MMPTANTRDRVVPSAGYDALMTVAALSTSSAAASEIEADVLVIGVRKTDDGPQLLSDDPALQPLALRLDAIGVTGGLDEVRRIPSEYGRCESLALVGVGSGELTTDDLRYAAGSAARQLRGIESIVFGLPADSSESALAILEGAAIGAYSYTDYRASSLESAKLPASSIVVASPVTDGEALAERAAAIAQAVHTVRDLVNQPPNDLYPESFADAAVALGADAGVEVTVLAEDELREGGFGGILGVGLGSPRGPRLVKVVWAPEGASKHVALVGKGITFDSGGLSLKPPASMVGMKYDMTGAATVLAVTIAAARLALPIKVTAWLCIAENLPSGTAMRPNDVLRVRGGKTVEVLNTDAEGRLILADAIVRACEDDPDYLIETFTLTGAQTVALGSRTPGVMGSDDFRDRVAALSQEVGENGWPMPLPEELKDDLKSTVADLANVSGSRFAGMLVAGVYLREFVAEGVEWAHVDIAGPAYNTGGPWGYTGKGGTGVPTRTMFAVIEDVAANG